MEGLARAYDAAVASATGDDVKVGSTTTRVTDFVNRGPDFESLYVFPPLLEACCRVIGRPFKLSSFHARTLRPHAPNQDLHVDVRRDSADWPLLGFLLMIDPFCSDNGTFFQIREFRCLVATMSEQGSHSCPGWCFARRHKAPRKALYGAPRRGENLISPVL
jgi:hypothetical protein